MTNENLEQYKGRKYRKYFCATGAYELFGNREVSGVYTVTDGYIGKTYKNEIVLFLMSQDENGKTDIVSLTEFNRPRASVGTPGIRWWAEWESARYPRRH